MIVTINTDASFSKLYQKGTYAFWIVSNHGRITRSGTLRKPCSRPEVAEFKCIINAMHKLAESNWEGITRVIINTDCLNVIHLMQGNKKMIKRWRLLSWGHDLLVKYDDMMLSYKESFLKDATIEHRHVKSHVSTDSKKQWVNDWCDKEAKKHLAAYLKTQLISHGE